MQLNSRTLLGISGVLSIVAAFILALKGSSDYGWFLLLTLILAFIMEI